MGHWRAPARGGDPDVEDEEVTFQGGGDGHAVSQHHSLQAPLIQRRMLSVSSAHLQPN